MVGDSDLALTCMPLNALTCIGWRMGQEQSASMLCIRVFHMGGLVGTLELKVLRRLVAPVMEAPFSKPQTESQVLQKLSDISPPSRFQSSHHQIYATERAMQVFKTCPFSLPNRPKKKTKMTLSLCHLWHQGDGRHHRPLKIAKEYHNFCHFAILV